MRKKLVRLTESDLHKIIKESVKKILREAEDNYQRLSVEKSRPGDIPPGDEDIYYPGDINPDVWDALQRGDYGHDDKYADIDDIDGYADERIDLAANYDDFPPMR